MNFNWFPSFRLPFHFAKSAEICLIAHDEVLIYAGANRHCGLKETDDYKHLLAPERLAEAAHHLLADNERNTPLLLALPSHEFVATELELPGVGAKNLANAVRYQLPMALPGMDAQKVLCAVNAGHASSSTHVALWLPASRAQSLFAAFDTRKLRLRGIVPRPLVGLSATDTAQTLIDQDGSTLTAVVWEQGRVRKWFYLPRAEYEEIEFRQQFEAQIAQLPPARTLQSAEDWCKQTAPLPAVTSGYCFIPPGAYQAKQAQRQKIHRRLWQSALVVALLIVLGALGSLYWYEYRIHRELRKLREQTRDISQLRAEVYAIEDRIAPITQFPQQNVADLLIKLNTLFPESAGYISSLRIEDGEVEIEGFSATPSEVLERLSAESSFLEVTFSCDIQNQPGEPRGDKFCIHFYLAGIDVPGYLEQYFPVENE